MTEPGSQIRGFFRTCWAFRDKIIWTWDFLALVIVAVAAFTLATDAQVVQLAPVLATATLALGAALVGVVVAGLAVVVALLDDDLLILMEADEKSGRVAGHLFPYWLVTGTGIASFLLALALVMTQSVLPAIWLRLLFASVAGLVVWTALGVFNLVASLQALGINRAILARGPRPTHRSDGGDQSDGLLNAVRNPEPRKQ